MKHRPQRPKVSGKTVNYWSMVYSVYCEAFDRTQDYVNRLIEDDSLTAEDKLTRIQQRFRIEKQDVKGYIKHE